MPVNPNEAPKCKVKGILGPWAVCYHSYILDGDTVCGFSGGCCYQVVKAKPATANFPHDDMGTPV